MITFLLGVFVTLTNQLFSFEIEGIASSWSLIKRLWVLVGFVSVGGILCVIVYATTIIAFIVSKPFWVLLMVLLVLLCTFVVSVLVVSFSN
ncbi:hypothetical protein SAMN05192559_107110 [Halobacillus karajensis]|uniref:Uncharacterized protein n=1 Tax=Halobacillus karajensis TaxID=195088 RepID=A0A024P8Y5_9BACI|nr:hypothetical protein [Halobacillus karajensis]CDQ20151.1 hypothetical protein BN982_02468 [Halobacillus karajensis]CDQ25186.1 hypothetical protein BN983_03497 [Halobacillus karajensis]CDQ28453.1 hypothetical protein BN981_02755 [Halobacillus karajensis]SEI01351.1 hypothetical protein SAMN05192559_107110 [Halobacillus karajensis]